MSINGRFVVFDIFKPIFGKFCSDESDERSPSSIVGRFEEGFPVELQVLIMDKLLHCAKLLFETARTRLVSQFFAVTETSFERKLCYSTYKTVCCLILGMAQF
jgi:hypothetical protein